MRRLLFNVHLYAGLIAGAFVMILGLTGAIMAFEPEIDHLLHWKLAYVTPQAHAISLGEAGALVAKAFPGQAISGYVISTAPDISYEVDLERSAAYVDQYAGRVLGARQAGMDFLGYVHQLHLRLLIGNRTDAGKRIVSWAGTAMLFLVISGIYLWWPYRRVTIQRGGSAKRFWFDVHAVVGIYTFVFLLVLTVTGVIIGFEHTTTPLLYKATGSQPSRPPELAVTPPPGARPITPDRAFEIARAALPGAAPFAVNVPEPNEPYFVRLRYPEDRTPGGRSRVIVEPYTGKVVFAEGSRTAPAGARLVIANRAIHTGDIFGIPSKALMSLASLLAVLQVVSGVMMWWRGRQARSRAGRSAA